MKKFRKMITIIISIISKIYSSKLVITFIKPYKFKTTTFLILLKFEKYKIFSYLSITLMYLSQRCVKSKLGNLLHLFFAA